VLYCLSAERDSLQRLDEVKAVT